MGVFLVFAVPTVCFAALLIAWLICDKKPEYKEGTYERIQYPKAMVNFCEVMNNWLAPLSIVLGVILLLVTISLGIAAGCCAGLKERKDAEFYTHYYETVMLAGGELVKTESDIEIIEIDTERFFVHFNEEDIPGLVGKCEDNYLTVKSETDSDKNIAAIYLYIKDINDINNKILYNRKHHGSFWTGWYNTGNYYNYKLIMFNPVKHIGE